MTTLFIVECDVCHHKYVFKCQCDHVMNHGIMPIRVGCKNCGNILCGEISAESVVMKRGIMHEGADYFKTDFPRVAVSTELPICADWYFTDGQILNNYLCLSHYVKDISIEHHSRRMSNLVDGTSLVLENLKTLYNIYRNGNTSVFSAYAEEKFDKDKEEAIKDKSDMQRGMVGILIQVFKEIASNAYRTQFTKPFVVELNNVIDNTDASTLKGLLSVISGKMNIDSDIDESLTVLMDFIVTIANFYPLMLLLEEGDFTSSNRGKLYLSTVDYAEVKSLFAEQFELLSRWSMLLVGLENIKVRGDYDKLSTKKSLSDFCKRSNGQKSEFILTNSWLKDYYLQTLDNKIRNGIDHAKTKYNAYTQVIEYYPNVNKPDEKYEIALIDFTFIILQQAIKLMESLCLAIVLRRVG